MMKPYGYELILDLHKCDCHNFNRRNIRGYFKAICKGIDMKKCECYFWDDVGLPEKQRQTAAHTRGTSAVQFILTSSIVVHSLDLLGSAYINVFSCKGFDAKKAEQISVEWFGARICRSRLIERSSE